MLLYIVKYWIFDKIIFSQDQFTCVIAEEDCEMHQNND